MLIGPRASACGISTLEQLSDLPLPRLSVVGTPTDSVVDEDIYAFISLMEEIFERPPDERFTVLWDIREGAFRRCGAQLASRGSTRTGAPTSGTRASRATPCC